MPVNPSTWTAGLPVTALQLNTDLYAYVSGNNHFPNGILFHSTPPLYMHNMSATTGLLQPSQPNGQVATIAQPGDWRNWVNTGALFGGQSLETVNTSGEITPSVNGNGGVAGNFGGIYLSWALTAFSATTNAGGSGVVFDYGGTFVSYGGIQRSSTTRGNGSFGIDLLTGNRTASLSFDIQGYCADPSGNNFAYSINAADFMGTSSFWGMLWAGPSAAGVTVPTSLPVPPTGYTGSTLITASSLNGSAVATPLAFLNNQPMLRASATLTTSIPNSGALSATLVPLGASATIDNWSKWNSGTSTWTAPVAGVYLVHGVVNYTASGTRNRAAGIQINGGTVIWGPAYSGAGSGITRPQVTRLIDLNANDTVTLVTSQDSGGALALSNSQPCRLVIKWMAALAGSNGSVSWTAPVTGFRWQAGTPGSQLPALFQAHLANDLSFLLQRPYLLSYQTAAQTAQPQNQFNPVTMGHLGGRIHNSAGDNYGGWTSGASNKYTAVVAGWYLAVATYTQAVPGATPASCVAGIGYFQPGGTAQGSSAQQAGQQISTTSTTYAPGAEIVSLFYLRAGDYLQPYYEQFDGGAYATSVAVAGQECSFGCVWVSE